MLVSLLKQGTIITVMMLAVFLLRQALGEPSVTEVGWPELLTVPLRHMALGPLVGLGSYGYKTVKLIPALGTTLTALSLLGTVLLFLLFRRLGRWEPLAQRSVSSRDPLGLFKSLIQGPSLAGGGAEDDPRQSNEQLLKLMLVGLLMLMLGYPLTFTMTPIALASRGTRVHLAGVVGAGLI